MYFSPPALVLTDRTLSETTARPNGDHEKESKPAMKTQVMYHDQNSPFQSSNSVWKSHSFESSLLPAPALITTLPRLQKKSALPSDSASPSQPNLRQKSQDTKLQTIRQDVQGGEKTNPTGRSVAFWYPPVLIYLPALTPS